MASSVDELKALANTKLGFARPNRFLVTFPTSFGGSGGILGSVLGLLNIGGGGASGRELNILCSNTTLPAKVTFCLLYTSPSPRDATLSRMPSSA